MSKITDVFMGDAKVVISPDEMRAWVMLPPPPVGQKYTVEALKAWLPENGVVYGVSNEFVREAIQSERYHELLEVARGDAPVDASGGDYALKVEKKPFTGLKGNSDGSLFYDDLSFLQEVEDGTILAEVDPPNPGYPGKTVTGEKVEPKLAEGSKVLSGTGFQMSIDGRYYIAPCLSHVNVVNDELIVTPLLKLEKLSAEDGPIDFDGNVLIEEDVLPGASITATGSIFVKGRAASANLKAGRNILLSEGMRFSGSYSELEAKENVWGLVFDSADIKAGGSICSTQLMGCEVTVGKRASILGGRGMISNTTLYAPEGVVALSLGDPAGSSTTISVGADTEMLEKYEGIEKRMDTLNTDIQAMQQSLSAYERINKNKPDRGRRDKAYKEMEDKKNQMVSVLNILDAERTRLKRAMDIMSSVSIVARDHVYPGVNIYVDTRFYEVTRQMDRVKFHRTKDIVEAVEAKTEKK